MRNICDAVFWKYGNVIFVMNWGNYIDNDNIDCPKFDIISIIIMSMWTYFGHFQCIPFFNSANFWQKLDGF